MYAITKINSKGPEKGTKFYLDLVLFPKWVADGPGGTFIKKVATKKEAEKLAKQYGGKVEKLK